MLLVYYFSLSFYSFSFPFTGIILLKATSDLFKKWIFIIYICLLSLVCIYVWYLCMHTKGRCVWMCVSLCLFLYLYVYIAFFIHKILLLTPVSLKGISVSVIVKDNHLLLWSSPPGCMLLVLSSNTPVAEIWDGWLSAAIYLLLQRKHIFMQHVSLHVNIYVLGKALFLGISRNIWVLMLSRHLANEYNKLFPAVVTLNHFTL